MKKGQITASMMCASIDKIFYYLTEFKENNIEFLHIDVMDGDFVPNLALGTDYVKSLRRVTNIPFDFHFLVNNPLEKMTWYDIREGDQVAFHYENNKDIQKCLNYLKRLGAKKFIAINPETSIECISEYLNQIDGVLVMTVNPGFAGMKILPNSFTKVKEIKEYLDNLELSNLDIIVDGNISIENAKKLYECGATIFVAGSSSLFSKNELSLSDIIRKKRSVIGWSDTNEKE